MYVISDKVLKIRTRDLKKGDILINAWDNRALVIEATKKFVTLRFSKPNDGSTDYEDVTYYFNKHEFLHFARMAHYQTLKEAIASPEMNEYKHMKVVHFIKEYDTITGSVRFTVEYDDTDKSEDLDFKKGLRIFNDFRYQDGVKLYRRSGRNYDSRIEDWLVIIEEMIIEQSVFKDKSKDYDRWCK